MSVNYFPETAVSFDEIFDGRLDALGLSEKVTEESNVTERAVTDGGNVLWIYRHPDGSCSATRYGGNDASRILMALEEAFGTMWLSDEETNEDDGSDEDGAP